MVLKKAIMTTNNPKCDFANFECQWLGHKITACGFTPLVRKTDPIHNLQPPRTMSQLMSFIGSAHSLDEYLSVLAETSAPLRPLLSEKNDFVWSAEVQLAFQALKTQVANIVGLKHFDVHKDICIVSIVAIMDKGRFLSN